MKNMLKDAAILLVITLVSGLALGFIYNITRMPIAEAEERARNEAFSIVSPDASSFVASEGIYEDFPDESIADEWNGAGFSGIKIDNVYFALSEAGEELGYVLLVTTREGYGGDISFAMGIKNDGTLNGISILEISETAGLGMRAPEVLVPQFKDKNVSSFTVTKTGATSDSEIDAISGATITSKAVTNAVNAGLYYFETQCGGALNAE